MAAAPGAGTADPRFFGMGASAARGRGNAVAGVCPQHDILWPDLTVEDHLLFYARLKGVSKKDEDLAVSDALARVSLTKFRHRQSKGLSGGEKRRLSIAIALIGDGQVIFLDEPTVSARTQFARGSLDRRPGFPD